MLLREKSVFNVSDVEYAILEPHGKLSVLKKPEKSEVMKQDEIWLNEKLKNHGMNLTNCSINRIFFTAVEENGQIFISMKKTAD